MFSKMIEHSSRASKLPKVAVAIISNGRRMNSLISLLAALNNQQGDGEKFQTFISVTLNIQGGSKSINLAPIEELVDCISFEAEQGIPFARNKSLEVIQGLGTDFVAFIDDDEIVPSNWLLKGLNEISYHKADGIAGKIDYLFEASPPRWQQMGGFYDSPNHKVGEHLESSRTGNLILKCASIWKLDQPYFDPKFKFSGGSDIDFTTKLVKAGSLIAWSNQFVSTEIVPKERCTRKWALLRAFRVGNQTGKSILKIHPFMGIAITLTIGLLRMFVSLAASPFAILSYSAKFKGKLVRIFMRGMGIASSSFYTFEEYKI